MGADSPAQPPPASPHRVVSHRRSMGKLLSRQQPQPGPDRSGAASSTVSTQLSMRPLIGTQEQAWCMRMAVFESLRPGCGMPGGSSLRQGQPGPAGTAARQGSRERANRAASPCQVLVRRFCAAMSLVSCASSAAHAAMASFARLTYSSRAAAPAASASARCRSSARAAAPASEHTFAHRPGGSSDPSQQSAPHVRPFQ